MAVPKVSVIIPNYNHARFLPMRIDSVLNQTFTDFELILLDDCSTDNSREILADYAKKDSRIKLAFNEVNSGSTFAQWNKGVALAKGEYIWLAESDDYCELNLLETLVPLLDNNKNVGIAFAQSTIVDENNKTINSYNENYKYIYKSDRWEHDFINSGHDECANYLIYSNTIPNASGALMRKSTFLACGGAETGWRLNGDWFFYVKMLLRSDLAYVAKHLNYFRFHTQTQRHKANENHVVYDEIIHTLQFIEENVSVDPEKISGAYIEVANWWGSSLARQDKSWSFFKENWRLYKFFRVKKPWLFVKLLFNIIHNYLVIILDFLHLRKPLKKYRAKLFPGKYFEY